MAYIVTIEPNGQPHILAEDMHEAAREGTLLEHAESICRLNPRGTVVWVLDADGEYPLYRFSKEGSDLVECKFTRHVGEEG